MISNSSLAEIARECKMKCKSMLAELPWLRRQFLTAQLQAAAEDDDIKKASDLKAIMRAERQRKGCKTTPKKQDLKGAIADEMDDLWEDMDAEDLEEIEPPKSQLTVLLASGDADVIKKLSNDGAEENLGMKVQPDGCNIRHLAALKDKVETWTSKVDGS